MKRHKKQSGYKSNNRKSKRRVLYSNKIKDFQTNLITRASIEEYDDLSKRRKEFHREVLRKNLISAMIDFDGNSVEVCSTVKWYRSMLHFQVGLSAMLSIKSEMKLINENMYQLKFPKPKDSDIDQMQNMMQLAVSLVDDEEWKGTLEKWRADGRMPTFEIGDTGRYAHSI